MVRYEQKSKKRRSGVQREKRKEKGLNGAEESRGANKKGNTRGIIMCQETPNKDGATVITPFLPTGFSRVLARKTRQPKPSQHDPTKPCHIKYSHEEGLGHISQGLTKFD